VFPHVTPRAIKPLEESIRGIAREFVEHMLSFDGECDFAADVAFLYPLRVIMTVLGSCIAACIWDSRSLVGGMNHFMLPEGEGGDSSGRYGSYAMELLINELMKQGARRETMQAKIFGGGAVMANFTTMNVGERNTKFVRDYLQTERIPVVSEDVLDIYPRKVCFFPVTGKAMVKRLAHAHPETMAQEKRGNVATVVQTTAGGSVDLF